MSIKENFKWALRSLDTPTRNEVVYGDGPKIWGDDTPGHMWYCGRCRSGGNGIASAVESETAAREHARLHDGVTVIKGVER